MDMHSKFSAVHIKPQRDFGTLEQAIHISELTSSFKLAGRFFHCPLLSVIVDQTGVPHVPTSLFLADLALMSRSVTGDTVRSYSEALLGWLEFLAKRQCQLESANEELLGVYRSELVNGRLLPSGEKYATSTTIHRIVVVCSFYRWSERRGYFHSSLGSFLQEIPISRPQFIRGVQIRHSRRLSPAVIRRLPRVVEAAELSRLTAVTAMPYRLMVRWCVATGMRRFEVCGLKLADLPTPNEVSSSTDGLCRIEIARKGSRVQTVHVPTSLVEDTNWYVLAERQVAANGHEKSVFLNRRRVTVSRASLTRAFRRSANSIGCRATLHHLRHTFAVNVLRFLESSEAEEAINSLKTLQILLGHANVSTTEIYLRAMETSSPSVIAALQFLYGASLDDVK
ncbi:tyrosine-type recombinase/integrase [Kinneretia aquatilis]|uniref:tyrosine-type recombinase/integrase n=1 Tax=Kinneretia aquatilis TaxID=2070761 RepID=UPI001CC05207|nr:site-specific integrase [Paucibacter aquatile]WIV98444.1 site-specific integrase [Paucibacter aquatile]